MTPADSARVLEQVGQVAELGVAIAAAAVGGETGLAIARLALSVLERAVAALRPIVAGRAPTREEWEALEAAVRSEADLARRFAESMRRGELRCPAQLPPPIVVDTGRPRRVGAKSDIHRVKSSATE